MKEKFVKWFPVVYIGIRLIHNIWRASIYPSITFAHRDADDVIICIIISFALIFTPMALLELFLIKAKKNMKYGLISASWLWLLAFLLIYSKVSDPPIFHP